MACTCVGLVAIIASAIALILSWVAFGVPLWSARNAQVDQANVEGTTDLSVGVWGICTDVSISVDTAVGDADFDADNCFLYYSSKEVRNFAREQADANNISVDVTVESRSLCNIYDETEAPPADLFVSPRFLKDTCGSLGKATLAMAVLAPIFGTFMVVFLLLGITCCKKNGIFVTLGSYLALFAFVFQVISFGLWVRQSRDLDDEDDGAIVNIEEDFNFNASFALAIVAAVFYLITTIFAFKHTSKGDKEDAEEQRRETEANATSDPIVGQQGTNVGV